MNNPLECEKCGEKTRRWRRCDAHYCCDGCGTTDGLCMHIDGLYCDGCRATLIAQRIVNFTDDTDYKPDAVCPWCGHVFDASWEFSDGDQECNDCDRAFDLTRHVEVTYSTQRIEHVEAK
ncbi:MAG: hypothetical protein ACYTFA_17300 [Planctomycetota bacterium]|jgi:hypothetical protein